MVDKLAIIIFREAYTNAWPTDHWRLEACCTACAVCAVSLITGYEFARVCSTTLPVRSPYSYAYTHTHDRAPTALSQQRRLRLQPFATAASGDDGWLCARLCAVHEMCALFCGWASFCCSRCGCDCDCGCVCCLCSYDRTQSALHSAHNACICVSVCSK